jgi:hypothetical protein
MIEAKNCKGAYYCGNWRSCDRCAAMRAARVADRAEYLEQRQGKLALAVARPSSNTRSEIKHLRDKLIRAKLAPAGIWTIETGELYVGLHLNILLPAREMYKFEKHAEYTEIIRTSARAAAAYICKRTGMPTHEQYSGRLQGEWGSLVQHLMSSNNIEAAPSQAAALNMILNGHRSIADYYKTDAEMALKAKAIWKENREKTRDEYAAIMRRNLPALYAAMRQNL